MKNYVIADHGKLFTRNKIRRFAEKLSSNLISAKHKIIRKQIHEIPENAIFLITNPRSGSTWLLDSLRCYPMVSMLRKATLYQDLNLSGRRYPRDLSRNAASGLEIEVRYENGLWAKIPDFKLDESFGVPSQLLEHKYMIEKIHPHFFEYDVEEFSRKIDQLRDRFPVKLIYLVREPRETLDSFFRYQDRNPDWNASRTFQDVIVHMQKTYQALEKLSNFQGGSVINYSDLLDHYQDTMLQLFDYLWPQANTDPEIVRRIVSTIEAKTARDARSGDTIFFSNTEKISNSRENEHRHLMEDAEVEINKIYRPYNELLMKRMNLN